MIREEPAGHRNCPGEIGRLGHFHVRSVGGQVHGTDAERDDVGTLIGLSVERDALRDGVMHSALHESVVAVGMLHLGHVVIGNGGLLRRTLRRKEKKKEKTGTHRAPRQIEAEREIPRRRAPRNGGFVTHSKRAKAVP